MGSADGGGDFELFISFESGGLDAACAQPLNKGFAHWGTSRKDMSGAVCRSLASRSQQKSSSVSFWSSALDWYWCCGERAAFGAGAAGG